MTIGQTSGTYNFTGGFSNAEMLFDAFERIGKSPAELTQTMLVSARRSLNLLLQSMANKGPALWAIELYTVVLQQGVSTITLPANISSVLDVYIRQYVNLQVVDLSLSGTLIDWDTPGATWDSGGTWDAGSSLSGFTTNIGQMTVNITQANHGLLAGQSIYIVTPVSVGGLILQGYYLVQNVPDQNDFTINSGSIATSSVVLGGQVPIFTSTISSGDVSVNLPNHGLSVGNGFTVPLQTTVGGIILQGRYAVSSVTDANDFVINSAQIASSAAVVPLNGGAAQISEQTSDSVPTDRVLTPMSRTDYSSLPYKAQQGFPYTFWYDRVIPSTLTFWQTPDNNGPYILNAYCLRQLQDANTGMGEIPDIQYRALEMMTARLAVKLSVKYAKDQYALLKAEADDEFGAWSEEEREKVPIFIQPQIGRYYRGN